jgi:hypothetical protein
LAQLAGRLVVRSHGRASSSDVVRWGSSELGRQWWQRSRSREGEPIKAKGEAEGELERVFNDVGARPRRGGAS